jgi:hypothetical protein
MQSDHGLVRNARPASASDQLRGVGEGCPTRTSVALTAIGRSLKDKYDVLATPIPPHLTALVKQLERRR